MLKSYVNFKDFKLKNLKIKASGVLPLGKTQSYANFPQEIECLYSGIIWGEKHTLVYCMNHLFLDGADILSCPRRPALYFENNLLYIFNTTELVVYDGTAKTSIELYTPTVMKNVNPETGEGDAFEKPNAVSELIKFEYLMQDDRALTFPEGDLSFVSVEGHTGGYSVSDTGISFAAVQSGKVTLTMSKSIDYLVYSAQAVSAFLANNRRMYALAVGTRVYYTYDLGYVCDYIETAGESVTGFAHHRERLIMAKPSSCYEVSFDKEIVLLELSSDIGSEIPPETAQGEPVLYCRHKLYKITSTALGEAGVREISCPYPLNVTDMCDDPDEGILYVASTRLLAYDYKNSVWSESDIEATLVSKSDRLYYTNGSDFRFLTDGGAGEVIIEDTDLGHPTARKFISDVYLTTDASSALNATVCCTLDGVNHTAVIRKGVAYEGKRCVKVSLMSGDFVHARISVNTDCALYGIHVHYTVGERIEC